MTNEQIIHRMIRALMLELRREKLSPEDGVACVMTSVLKILGTIAIVLDKDNDPKEFTIDILNQAINQLKQ